VTTKGPSVAPAAKSPASDASKKTTVNKVTQPQSTKGASASATRDKSGKPPIARQGSSQEDSVSLNAKVESIKAAHERRLNEQKNAKQNMPESSKSLRAHEELSTNQAHEEKEEEGHDARPASKHRFRILSRRSSSSKPSLTCPGSKSKSMDKEETPTLREEESSLPIPIAHYAGKMSFSRMTPDASDIYPL